jgi:hypothetical protein
MDVTKLTNDELLEEIKWNNKVIDLLKEESNYSSKTKHRLIDEVLDKIAILVKEKKFRGLK